MLCDADTHFAPTEIYKKFDPDLTQRMFAHCHPVDKDQVWCRHYNQIKSPEWPACDRVDDFVNLPQHIRSTFKEKHMIPGLFISDDLNKIYFDPPENDFPDIFEYQTTSNLILRTDRQILNPNLQGLIDPLNYHLDSSIVREYTKNWNDGVLELCGQSNKFDTTFFLSLQDEKGSQDEFERCKDKSYFGVRIIDHYPWGFLDQFDWLWQACEKHQIPVYQHLGGFFSHAPLNWKWNYWNPRYQVMIDEWPYPRFGDKGQGWVIGIVSFITEGILDRYPNLRIISCEHGLGWIPEVRKFMLAQGWPDPLPYFRKNFWFTTEVEEPFFVNLAKTVGWDRLLYSSDYPHNDPGGNNRYKDYQDIQQLLESKKISQENFDLYTHKNYLKLKERSA